MHNELGHHGVVKRADAVALPHAIVKAHCASFKRRVRRFFVNLQLTGGRQEMIVWVFCANARFYGVALQLYLVLPQRQWLATGHTQLPLHQVQARNRFCHGMFHLQTRVHLHEEKGHGHLARSLVMALLHNELNSACAHIIYGTRGRHSSLAHLLAKGVRQSGSRRFFQDLLMSPLNRAIAFHEVHAIALRVGKHLDFDVARTLHVFFNQHRLIAKAVLRFALARRQCFGKVCRVFDNAHAFATAAGTGFDEHRIANPIGFKLQQRWVLIGTVIARHQRHAGLFHELLGFCFEAHGLNGRRGWANEHQARCGTRLGKGFVLA